MTSAGCFVPCLLYFVLVLIFPICLYVLSLLFYLSARATARATARASARATAYPPVRRPDPFTHSTHSTHARCSIHAFARFSIN